MTWPLDPNRIRVVDLVSRRLAARRSSVPPCLWKRGVGTLDATLLSRQANLRMVEGNGRTFRSLESF